MPLVVPAAEGVETLELNGLNLNDGILGLSQLDCPPPRQRQEWVGAADSEHQELVRNPLHENRQITARINVAPQGNMDAALARVADIVTMLQFASLTVDGIPLVWQPADGTIPVTFDVLDGEITEMPIDWENGWMAKAPTVTVVMTAKPYWRGEETLTGTTSSSTPITIMEIVNLIGDVPALGRLIVTDTATQSRRHVEWGLEGPETYNAATSLLLDSDSLVTSGFAGVQFTSSGAYDPNALGTNSVRADLYSSPVAVCGTGNQSHVGVFKVKARVNASFPAVHRFTWQVGDGPVTSNSWVANTGSDTWVELDLGTITIAPVKSGTQRWKGSVEAYISSPGAFSTIVDYLILVPVLDGYGKARATYSYRPGVIVGSDLFTSTTAGNNLNARVAPAGGTWATSGGGTDFVFADGAGGTELLTRGNASTARYAVLGSTNYTDVEVAARFRFDFAGITPVRTAGVIARWTSATAYLRAELDTDSRLRIVKVVGGVETVLADSGELSMFITSLDEVRLVVFASGTAVARVTDSSGALRAQLVASDTTLATGGTLATGKPAIVDNPYAVSITSNAVWIDDFQIATPTAEPIVVYSGRTIEFRSDTTIRQDATGTYAGPPSSYFPAGRFRVPVGTSRVLVKARRNDIDTATDDQVTDPTQIQVAVTSRGLVVPRG